MKTILCILLICCLAVSATAKKALPKEPVNINTADAKILMTLPGIGAKKAQAIISYRTKTPFKAPGEIDNVNGIGPKMTAKMLPYIKISEEPK